MSSHELVQRMFTFEQFINRFVDSLDEQVIKDHPRLVIMAAESLCHRARELTLAANELAIKDSI